MYMQQHMPDSRLSVCGGDLSPSHLVCSLCPKADASFMPLPNRAVALLLNNNMQQDRLMHERPDIKAKCMKEDTLMHEWTACVLQQRIVTT